MSTINDRALRKTPSLALGTNMALGDVAHSKDMQSFVEYALTATNTQLNRRLEGEKVATIPSTFSEAMKLPEAARWKAVTIKEMSSLKDLGVYNLVPISTIPPDDRVKVSVQAKSGRHLLGTHPGPGVERSAGSRLRWNLQSSLQTTGHPDGNCHRGGEERGVSPTRRANDVPRRENRTGDVRRIERETYVADSGF